MPQALPAPTAQLSHPTPPEQKPVGPQTQTCYRHTAICSSFQPSRLVLTVISSQTGGETVNRLRVIAPRPQATGTRPCVCVQAGRPPRHPRYCGQALESQPGFPSPFPATARAMQPTVDPAWDRGGRGRGLGMQVGELLPLAHPAGPAHASHRDAWCLSRSGGGPRRPFALAEWGAGGEGREGCRAPPARRRGGHRVRAPAPGPGRPATAAALASRVSTGRARGPGFPGAGTPVTAAPACVGR